MPTLRKLTTIWVSREGASLCGWKFPRSCAQGRSGGEGLSAGKRPTWRAGAVTRGGDISGQVGKGSFSRSLRRGWTPYCVQAKRGTGLGLPHAAHCVLGKWDFRACLLAL